MNTNWRGRKQQLKVTWEDRLRVWLHCWSGNERRDLGYEPGWTCSTHRVFINQAVISPSCPSPEGRSPPRQLSFHQYGQQNNGFWIFHVLIWGYMKAGALRWCLVFCPGAGMGRFDDGCLSCARSSPTGLFFWGRWVHSHGGWASLHHRNKASAGTRQRSGLNAHTTHTWACDLWPHDTTVSTSCCSRLTTFTIYEVLKSCQHFELLNEH